MGAETVDLLDEGADFGFLAGEVGAEARRFEGTRMRAAQGTVQGREGGVDERKDGRFGGLEDACSGAETSASRCLPSCGLLLGLGGEDLQEELLVELGLIAFGGGGEKLVADVHHDPVVAGGVAACSARVALSSLVMRAGLPAASRRWSRQVRSSSRAA